MALHKIRPKSNFVLFNDAISSKKTKFQLKL